MNVCDPYAPEGPGRAFLVAEIGNNHEGDLDAAREMVREAARAGADAVKFQTFRTEFFVHPSDVARTARMTRFELSPSAFVELADEARRAGILFFSTPLDLASADALEPLVWSFKIASGDNDFTPLIERVAASRKPLIVSTGVSGLADVEQAVGTVRAVWRDAAHEGKLALTHCVSAYPAPRSDANLRSLGTLKERFPDVSIGYSDHTLGIQTCLYAAALGARIIEKHFTLDKARSDFRDHQLSADPAELHALRVGLEEVAALLGTPGKSVQPSEAPQAVAIRRSVFLASDVPAGNVLHATDLVCLRPGDGIRPTRVREIVGRRATRDLKAGEKLAEGDYDGGA